MLNVPCTNKGATCIGVMTVDFGRKGFLVWDVLGLNRPGKNLVTVSVPTIMKFMASGGAKSFHGVVYSLCPCLPRNDLKQSSDFYIYRGLGNA